MLWKDIANWVSSAYHVYDFLTHNTTFLSSRRTAGIGERQNSKCRRYGFLPYHSASYIIARLLSWYGRKPYLLRFVRI